MSEIAACPLSPFANNPSALPSPTSSLLQSGTPFSWSFDASPCMPTVVLYYYTLQGAMF